jgi:hypothetical protein
MSLKKTRLNVLGIYSYYPHVSSVSTVHTVEFLTLSIVGTYMMKAEKKGCV